MPVVDVRGVKDEMEERRTPMNRDRARPLATGSLYKSAYMPPVTAIGLLALIPVITRNIRSPAKLGARAHAIVKIMKMLNVMVMRTFLP